MGPRTIDEHKAITAALEELAVKGDAVVELETALKDARSARLAAAKSAHDAGAIYDLIAEAARVTRDAVKKWAADWR